MNALKSKTLWFNALIAVLAVLELSQPLVREVIGANAGIILLLVAMTGAMLRAVTTTPLSEK